MAVFLGRVRALSSRAHRLLRPLVGSCALIFSLSAAAQALPAAEDSQGSAIAWKAAGKDVIKAQGKAAGSEREWGFDWARLEVPLPGTVALFSLGLVCLVVGRPRRGR